MIPRKPNPPPDVELTWLGRLLFYILLAALLALAVLAHGCKESRTRKDRTVDRPVRE